METENKVEYWMSHATLVLENRDYIHIFSYFCGPKLFPLGRYLGVKLLCCMAGIYLIF